MTTASHTFYTRCASRKQLSKDVLSGWQVIFLSFLWCVLQFIWVDMPMDPKKQLSLHSSFYRKACLGTQCFWPIDISSHISSQKLSIPTSLKLCLACLLPPQIASCTPSSSGLSLACTHDRSMASSLWIGSKKNSVSRKQKLMQNSPGQPRQNLKLLLCGHLQMSDVGLFCCWCGCCDRSFSHKVPACLTTFSYLSQTPLITIHGSSRLEHFKRAGSGCSFCEYKEWAF